MKFVITALTFVNGVPQIERIQVNNIGLGDSFSIKDKDGTRTVIVIDVLPEDP